jgi:hypothetical protein
MNYYLVHFTPLTWQAFQDHGSSITGFPESAKKRAAGVVPGDVFICYLIKFSRWCGALQVLGRPYIDHSPIFSSINDKYVVRFRVKPIVVLEPAQAIPVSELWDQLNRTKNVDKDKFGWAWKARLTKSLASIDPIDGQVLAKRLGSQAERPITYELKALTKKRSLRESKISLRLLK